jgi:hypothetical protein
VIITAGRREAQLCWSERWTGFSARTGTRPPQINLAEHRICRKQILGGLTHEYQIAA